MEKLLLDQIKEHVRITIENLEWNIQDHLGKSMVGDDRCPDRMYEVGMSEAYNDALNSLYELRDMFPPEDGSSGREPKQ